MLNTEDKTQIKTDFKEGLLEAPNTISPRKAQLQRLETLFYNEMLNQSTLLDIEEGS